MSVRNQCKDFRTGLIHSLSVSEDSSSSVLNQLQLSNRCFSETCEDTITVVQSAEDKSMDKFRDVESFESLLQARTFLRRSS